jgi:hypothetical protein
VPPPQQRQKHQVFDRIHMGRKARSGLIADGRRCLMPHFTRICATRPAAKKVTRIAEECR